MRYYKWHFFGNIYQLQPLEDILYIAESCMMHKSSSVMFDDSYKNTALSICCFWSDILFKDQSLGPTAVIAKLDGSQVS